MAICAIGPWAGASEVRVRTKAGGQAGVAGTVASSAGSAAGAPARVDLSVPSLGPGSLAAPGAPELRLDVEAGEGLGALPMLGDLPAVVPSAIPAEVSGGASSLHGVAAEPGSEQAGAAAPAQEGGAPGAESEESGVSAGQVMFDAAAVSPKQGASAPAGLWQRFKAYLRPDLIPAWPGKGGDVVRLAGTTYRLERRIGESHVSTVWSVTGDPKAVVKLIRPEFAGDGHYGREVEALEALAHTGISHARLRAASPDGLVLVKDFVEGESLGQVASRGEMRPGRLSALAAMAAELLSIGYTADLAPANLVFDRWTTRWSLVDAGGFKPGGAADVLSQLWSDDLFGRKPGDREAAKLRFLTNLRVRLGPASAAWKEIVRHADRIPGLRKALEELARFDAERPPPKVVFASEPEDAAVSDRMVSYREVEARLGFDPMRAENRQRLHLDDQGKLNTEITKIEPPGRRPMVVKLADRDIIRRELATRRIVRRWFSRYFATPASLGWGDGMVMEFSDGSMSYAGSRLDLPSRVAFAILAHSFGLSDVNPGNVFYRGQDRAVLIDFEQSLSEVRPHFGRLSIDSVVSELPWMAPSGGNRVQDYLPAIAEWRKVFARQESQKALEDILLESGFSRAEMPGLLAAFRRNVSLLELSVLADVEYVNAYADGMRPTGRPSYP
ncbi:MAG: hypothetical protein HY924_16180 [Elusimicrobia bacterium]|nr:hypothetical protein [Elusimicrobiota bacterium]